MSGHGWRGLRRLCRCSVAALSLLCCCCVAGQMRRSHPCQRQARVPCYLVTQHVYSWSPLPRARRKLFLRKILIPLSITQPAPWFALHLETSIYLVNIRPNRASHISPSIHFGIKQIPNLSITKAISDWQLEAKCVKAVFLSVHQGLAGFGRGILQGPAGISCCSW